MPRKFRLTDWQTNMRILVAIDDTDNEESIGTGRLARMLADDLECSGLLSDSSVTRHQLLVHPSIPYTSHNSCACIAGYAIDSGPEEIGNRARSFLQENFHKGANPGLCVMKEESVPDALREFGMRAQREVIRLTEGKSLAGSADFFIWMGGETGQGCIGSMAGVGLRSTGNDGRFIGLKGIREIAGTMSVKAIVENCDVFQVVSTKNEILGADERIETLDWVRPSLRNGKPVMLVKREGDIWCPAERKKKSK